MSKTIRELTEDLLAAPSACAEVKETAQNYLDAIGGENEAAAAKTFVAELEEDIIFLHEIPMKHGTWTPRKERNFRYRTASGIQKAGRSEENWMICEKQNRLIRKPLALQIWQLIWW